MLPNILPQESPTEQRILGPEMPIVLLRSAALDQCFSDFNVRLNHLGVWLIRGF